jgi:two-component system OmpR family sensor kinase
VPAPRSLLPYRRLLRTSLRVRLVLGLLVLAAVGLGVADVVGVDVLRASQLRRIDEQLTAVDGRFRPASVTTRTRSLASQLCTRPTQPVGGRRGPDTFYQACFGTDGALIDSNLGQSSLAPPQLSAVTVAQARDRHGRPFTVAATTGRQQWRVIETPLPDGSGVLVAGQSLRELASTTDQLATIDLAVSGAVLAVLLLLGYALVRVGLRPLDEVTATADRIRDGDLAARAAVGDAPREVARLGQAFDSMLEQIQRAFADREQAAARLRQFAADASHELRTPLTSIRGFAELHRQGAVPPGPDLDRVMRRIEDEAIRMGSLVEDLLALARLDRGPSQTLVDVDLAHIADDAVHDALAIAPAQPITLEASGPVVVRGDDGQLRQVVTNLLANARTHTPPGTAVVVRTYADGDAGVLEVADQGPGLDAETAARVFDRFWRADPARTREHGGAGLGLAIVAAIAGVHGGEASVEPTPGHGATFRVRLPR